MATRAVVLHLGYPGIREERLGRILTFFGIDWQALSVSALEEHQDRLSPDVEYAVFASLSAFAAADGTEAPGAIFRRAKALYAYADEDLEASDAALQRLAWLPDWSLGPAPTNSLHLLVAEDEAAGPMAAVALTARMSPNDLILVPRGNVESHEPARLVTAGGAPVFVRMQHGAVPIFFCTSTAVVDLDAPVAGGFYDIKEHFCTAVPLVMFLRAAFGDVMWRPQELGACLIIDDPLLKPRYGFCDFRKLHSLMEQYGFTTNIAFIPWNWRRTSSSAASLFGREPGRFSVSVHGCDHTAGEFGHTSGELLDSKAALALARMRRHQERTGISHDPVMVFPQGVFSSQSPAALKRHGFIAAVNTEVHPIDPGCPRTSIRDVWDVAITRHGGFPIFTRRYPSHGIENFAFDMLLGKPCFIVTHHQFFRDGGAELVDFLGRLGRLRSSLTWRPLGEAIRRACRRRPSVGNGAAEVEMYGTELVIANPSSVPVRLRVRKREGDAAKVVAVESPEGSIAWTLVEGHAVFEKEVAPGQQASLAVRYEYSPTPAVRRSPRFEAAVAARRLLSELRDEYIQTTGRRPAARRDRAEPKRQSQP